MRKVKFNNNQYYHIYNRGVDKRNVFIEDNDYSRFSKNLKDFNNSSYFEQRKRVKFSKDNIQELSSFLRGQEKMVEIVSYSLIPNHFHLIIKQIQDNGISAFMHKIGTSYTNYFNKKYDRSGALFQGTYKAIQIDNNDYLLWLAGYVNGNIEIHQGEIGEIYKWSSFQYFLDKEQNKILGDTNIISSQFKAPNDFRLFVKQVIKESRIRKEREKYLLEQI